MYILVIIYRNQICKYLRTVAGRAVRDVLDGPRERLRALVEPRVLDGGPRRALEALAPALGLLRRHVPALLRGPRVVPNSWQILGKILLVFYCIDANLRK